MPQYIQLPDGRYFEMKEGETVADARQAAIEKYPEAFKSAEKPKPKRDTTGARAAAAAGFEELKGQAALTAAKLGFGDEQAAEQYFRERQQAARERFTPTEKGWTEAPLTKLAETIGGSIPYIAAPAAASGIAALAATGVGAPAAVSLLGAGAASGLANYVQFVGSNLGRQMEPEGTKLADTNLVAAASAAAPQAIFDTAVMMLMPGVGKLFGSVGSKLTTQEARAIANQTVRQAVADYAKTAGGAMTREGITETLQQVLERAQAGLSISDPEARKEYIDSFIGGAALAGVGSPVGRGYERYKAREQAEEADIADRRKALEDALAQQEQERQQEEAYKQTPAYALKVNDQITQLEQQKIELQKQIRKITKDSPTEAVDKAFNREINAQLKENASQRNALAPEYNQLKKSGLLDKALEEQRVAGLSPMDYMLERTRTVPSHAPAGQAQDISTEDNWMVAPDRAAVLAQQEQEQQAAAQAEAPTKYAAQQLGIMVEQNYLPEEASALNVQETAMFVPYLMADPQMAQQLVDNQVRIPGLNLRKNTQVLKALSEALASMPKPPEVQTATPAPAEAPAPVEGPAPRELSVMPTAVDQGDLFGQTGSGVINRPSYSSAEAIAQKLAELNEQYKAARLAQNARPDRRARPTTQMRQIVKEMNLLREMQQEISDEAQDTSRKDFGTETAELQTKLGSVPKLEAAQVQRNDTLRNMFDPEAGVSPQDVVAALVDEIQTVRPGLKPETITAIEQEALPALEQAAQGKMPNITDALDSLSAKWRGATASNPTFTRTAVPSTVSPQMLATQINRAFEQRNRDNTLTNFTPEEQSLLQKVIDNFGAIQNQPESLNLFSDWLNRKATSPQAAQNLLPDVQAQLAAIEEGKYDNSQQQELGAELMPEAVAPQAQTQVEGGKATFVSPQDVGPLQTPGAQLYAPQQKAEVFDSFEDFDRYLASDYLKAARAAQGMPRDTVSRMTQDIGALEQKLAAVGQRRAAIEQRKAQLANVRDSERRVGMQLVGDAEVKLGEVETVLRKDLDTLNTQYEKYQTQFDQANADSDRISQNIAANTAKFVKGHDNFVAAADDVAKAKAELLKARNKLGSIGEKLPGIVEARTKVLEALKRMRNPDAYAIETKIQTLTEQLKRALDANKQVIGGEADQGSGTVRRIYQQIAELRQQQRQVKPYVPSVAIVRFIDQDLALQQQQLAVERRLDNAARGMLRTGMAVQEETQALEQRRAASPELAAAKKEVETARTLAKDATKGTEGEMVLADIEAEQEGAAAAGIRSQIEQKRGEITAAGEERTVSIGGKKWAMGPVPAERSAAEQRNKKEREDFQDRADRLAAIPGERIDFENRREMLAMVKATNDDKAQLDADIAENDEGIFELSVRKQIAQDKLTEITENLQGAERDVREKLGADAEKLKQYVAATDKRIATLRTYGEQLQKTKAKRAAALEKAERVFSSDPEVAAAVTESIDKRIEKLKRNIDKQDELIKKTTDPETGAPVSEDTQKERKKRRREYMKELQALVAQRSNRLGIRRTDAQTGEKISDIIAKKPEQALQTQLDEARARLKTLREDLGKLSDTPAKKPKQALQTQIDEAKANVQQLKEALEKLVAARAKKPGQELQIQIDEAQARVAMLKESRAKLADLEKQRDAAEKAGNKNARAKLQTKINEVLLEISQLQPEQLGKVSQATRIQSSAPAKFRAGTAETKAESGSVKTPVVEQRDVKQPKAEQAVAEANAFVKRLNDAKTTEQLQAEFAAMAERTQQQILQAQLEETNRLIGQRDTIQREIAQLEAVVAQSPDRVQPATAARLNKLRKELPGVLDILGKRIADRAQLEAVVENGGMVVDLSGTEMTAKAPRSGLAESFEEADDFEFGEEGRFKIANSDKPGMARDAIERWVAKVVSQWANAPTVKVLENEKGLPVRILRQASKDGIIGRIPGVYDPKTKTVYLVATNLPTVDEVIATLAHETVGHFGLQSVLGASYSKTMQRLYEGSSRVRRLADAKIKDMPTLSKDVAVEEALAEMAEGNKKDDRSVLQFVYDKIRDALRKIFGKDVVREEYVQQILANALRYVTNGDVQTGGVMPEGEARFRSTGATSALESLADKTIGKPKTFREKLGKNIALEAEMQGVDMRAGLREALKAGAKGMGDDKLFTQGMYSVIKADQKLPLIYSVMSNGVPELYKDAKGLTGVRTTGRDSAADVFKAIAELPVDAKRRATVAQMYMVAQRAKNKGVSKLDIGALGITDAEIDAVLAEVDADAPLKKALENVRRQYNAYNKGLIDFLASTGAITKAEATRLNKDGDYVPFYRVNENGMAELVFGGNTMITIGDIRRQPYLNQLKGGETKLLPLDEAIPRNTFLLMDKALTNYAARNVAYALQEIGRSSKKMVIKKGDGRAGADVIRFNQEPDPNDPSDTGKRHVIVDTIDTLAEGVPSELLVKSLEGAHLPLPEFLKLAGAASDLLRAGVTRMPMYIARQLFRDPMAAAFTGGLNYGPMRAVAKAGREFVRMSAGNSQTQAKLLEKGLIQSNIFSGDVDDIGDMARRIVQNREAPLYRKIFDAMDRTALRADAATRALVYDNAIANGLSEVEADMMTMESMNFYKRGLSPTVQYANRLIPFLNAQIQGLNVLYKAATGKMPFEESQRIKKKFFTNAAFLVSLGLVYAMAMQDDEYYKNARPRDRYTNFFLHLPGVDEPVKLPIPYEAGYFFSLAVAAVDGMMGEVRTKDQLTALRDMFLQSVPGYTSMGVPQIVKPAFEVFTNKNFLTGAPIESLRMKNLDTEQRYNTTTTELAKRISEAFPVLSPVQIEHLVRGYLGSMPLAIAAGANEMFAGADQGERPTGRMSDMPFIGTAFQKRIGGADSEAVARLAEDAMQARTTLSTMLKEGRREEATEYKQENMARLGAATAAGQYRQLVGRINTEIRRVQERSDMTGDAKRARIDTLEDAKLQAARRFMEVVRRLEEKEG